MPFHQDFPATTRILVTKPGTSVHMHHPRRDADAFCCMLMDEMPGAQRGVHPTGNPSTGWFKVPPAVPLSPAVRGCTRI